MVTLHLGGRQMELRQLQRFLSVAESECILTASSVLGIAQPVLSREIKQLEEELQAKLFYRHGRGARLTEAGVHFRMTVAPLVRRLLQAKSELAGRTEVPAGSLSFAMPPSLSAVIGPRVVKVFLTQFPDVKLHYIDGYSGHVNEWIVGGRVDMAVINNGSRAQTTRLDPLLTTELFFVAHRDIFESDNLDRETIPFDRAASIPMVLPAQPHGLRRVLDIAGRKRGAELKVVVEVDALTTITDLVQSKVGATILPHGPFIFDASDPDLIVRRLAEPNLSLKFMIAYSTERPFTFAMRQLAKTLRAEIRKAISEGAMEGRILN
jgi:LysR family transcriptional regulator, nitrogen assimilation regulatory protein